MGFLPIPSLDGVDFTPMEMLGVAAAAVAVVGITVFGWESGYEGGGLLQTSIGVSIAALVVLMVLRDRL